MKIEEVSKQEGKDKEKEIKIDMQEQAYIIRIKVTRGQGIEKKTHKGSVSNRASLYQGIRKGLTLRGQNTSKEKEREGKGELKGCR